MNEVNSRPHEVSDTIGHDDGFTLMEVLAALVILSVAIIGLISATTNATRAVTTVETRTLASIVADNAVAIVRTNPNDNGRSTREGSVTQMGQEFSWRVDVEDTELPTLRELTATVEQEGRVLVTRTSFLATEPPVQLPDNF